MRKISVFLGIFLITLGGCSSADQIRPGHNDAVANADSGAYPPNYRDVVQSWSRSNLSGAAALQFGRVSRPRRDWVVSGAQKVYGWSVCAMISAPNAYGEYTGPQTFWFLIRGDKVVGTRQSYTISPGHYVNCSDGDAPATT
jgi:hypothetical protein